MSKKSGDSRFYWGLIFTSISLLFLLILCNVFGKSGAIVTNALIGVFGLSVYGITIAFFIIGILKFFGFGIGASKIKAVKVLLLYTAAILLLHTMSSKDMAVGASYGKYLSQCYDSATTAGGAVAGLILYPIIKLNGVFAMVLTALIFAAVLAWVFFGNMGKSAKVRSRSVKYGKKKAELTEFDGKASSVGDIKDNKLHNESMDGKYDDKIKRSYFSKEVDYTPIERELDDVVLEYKDEIHDDTTSAYKQVMSNRPQRDDTEFEKRRREAYNKLYNYKKEVIFDEPSDNAAEISKPTTENYDENRSILDKIKRDDDYELYSNNSRLELLRKNSERLLEDKDDISITDGFNDGILESDGRSIFEEIDKVINNDLKFDERPETDELSDETQSPNVDDKIIDEDIRVVKDETQRADIEGFDNLHIRKELKKTSGDYKYSANDLISNGDKDISDKDNVSKFRSDKGGTHDRSDDRTEEKKFINPFSVPAGQVGNTDRNVEETKPKQEEKKVTAPIKRRPYIAPPINLLRDYDSKIEREDFSQHCAALERKLAEFDITAKVVNVIQGPTFSRMELQLQQGSGVSVKKISGLADDIAMCLMAEKVRIQAPIPGKNAIGVEIPNRKRAMVGLKEVFQSPQFNNSKCKVAFALGKDIEGVCHVCDMTKMPHMLIAGATGAGKSVCINTLLCSILYKYSPEDVRLLLVDPKQVELENYSGLPHMLLKNVISEDKKVLNLLDWAIAEMERRYTLLREAKVFKIDEYNEQRDKKTQPKMPYILIVVDEVADLITGLKKSLEDRIKKLTAKSRAAGIHLVLATQRPSVDVITGTIKANLPSRIAFATVQYEDSKTILGTGGAEKLLRNGDMLFSDSSTGSLVRIQGAFISSGEVGAVTDYVKANNEPYFDEEIDKIINTVEEEEPVSAPSGGIKKAMNEPDELFLIALRKVIESGNPSISNIQRKLSLGFPRAAKIRDMMDSCGYTHGNKVVITMEEFIDTYGNEAGLE